MTNEVFSLLLDKRRCELSDKAVESGLNKTERAELRALTAHCDKAPAVAQRIRILAAKMAQQNYLGILVLRFSRKFKQNLAELEALVQYGNSKAVWEIAYLYRKQATQKLNQVEKSELHYLTLYHDSPAVLRLTELKMKEDYGCLSSGENRELASLQRNIYQRDGIPHQLLEMLWPSQQPLHVDLR
jgi:hypothetical protein